MIYRESSFAKRSQQALQLRNQRLDGRNIVTLMVEIATGGANYRVRGQMGFDNQCPATDPGWLLQSLCISMMTSAVVAGEIDPS